MQFQDYNKCYLKIHTLSAYGNIKYNCDQCDYTGTTPSNLMVHQHKIYEGIRYSCNLCEFDFTEKIYMKTHTAKVHNCHVS